MNKFVSFASIVGHLGNDTAVLNKINMIFLLYFTSLLCLHHSS